MKKSLSYKTARIISNIFVPPSFTFLLFLLAALTFESEFNGKWIVLLSGLFYGLILPIIFFVILRKWSKVSNIDATIKEERTVPYLIGIILSLSAALTLYSFGTSSISIFLWLIYASNTFLMILINKFWKISAHAIGASIPMGALIYIYGASSIYYLLVIAVISWSRLKLKVHTPAQVLAGILFGIVLTYLQIILLTNLNT
ncbi:MAG: hypothetical protein K9J16_07515 [Melioribacteraceae bacterium]|nr:hypothetical protein [Melioribacteraceae bacterium]MCF8353441.1 hypothetical protein [Melioribacteraceae bacterium]MCF8393929.1 hypothetical protein [Melioribacteraceae bacterium]MCF8419002.1 hypothetical protein [Melioribacteraceae bacterium]